MDRNQIIQQIRELTIKYERLDDQRKSPGPKMAKRIDALKQELRKILQNEK